jgi:hypothetical protein
MIIRWNSDVPSKIVKGLPVAELGFYVGCLNLADQLAAQGVPTSVPEPAPASPPAFSCTGLRDASLALRSKGGTVVGNDVQADGKSLVNSGDS